MTPDQLIEQCKLAIRWAESVKAGKEIEIQWRARGAETWATITYPKWDFCTYEYREKPRPYECYLVLTRGGQLIGKYDAEDVDEGKAFARNNDLISRHMREVVE